jgi:hypothetical protein
VAYPNPTLYPSGTFYPRRYEDAPNVGPVGPPRFGLFPGPGKTPGHLIGAGSEFDTPILYRRIYFPSTTIYPYIGLYPGRTDFSPKARNGAMRVRGRMSWALVREGLLRQFRVQYEGAGDFNMVGVFSSDLYGRMTAMVEFADYDLDVEMASVEVDVEIE